MQDKTLSQEEFIDLLFYCLAKKGKMLSNKTYKFNLPADYKQRIEKILMNDELKNKFFLLINMEKYYENHFLWESQLVFSLERAILEFDLSYQYEFFSDNIIFTINQVYIKNIKKKYSRKIIELMKYFSSLLIADVYSRQYIEVENEKKRLIKNKAIKK